MKSLLSFKCLLATALCATTSVFSYQTYFSYSDEEVRTLQGIPTELSMQKPTLEDWDEIAEKAVAKSDMTYHESVRMYAYLYRAQADAAFLSCSVKGKFAGSLEPVSGEILSLFFPDIERKKTDPYSEKLAEIVVTRVKARLAKEARSEEEYKVPNAKRADNSYGHFMAKWLPWYLQCPKAFWPAPPPEKDSPVWRDQVKTIHHLQECMNDCMHKAIRYWAGLAENGGGDWRCLANNTLYSPGVPLGKALEVRAVLMTALVDTDIVCFSAKYHYMVPRPKVYDPSIHYEIPVPKHPSYVSGHSIESMAMATLLSHYFPSESCKFYAWADQCGESRIWGGIHYPVDHIYGQAAGKRIAEAILDQLNCRR